MLFYTTIMNRWFTVVGTMLVIPCIGAVYAWSIYRDPLAIILAEHQNVSPESLSTPLNFVFSIIIFFFAVGAIPGGIIQDKIGPKKVPTAQVAKGESVVSSING